MGQPTDSVSVARHCSICARDWPDLIAYHQCPGCGEITDRVNNVEPMDRDEAWSLKLHLDFQHFYNEWDMTHDPARLSPDYEEPNDPV